MKHLTQGFEFDLQTSPSKLRLVMAFHIANHSTLQEHEASRIAETLRNTKEKNNSHIISKEQSMIRVTLTFDVDFYYELIHQSQKTAPSAQPAKKITFE